MSPAMTPERTQAFMQRVGIRTPVALDVDASVYRSYDALQRAGAVAPYPRQYVIDGAGRVVYAANRHSPTAVRRALE